MGHNTVSDVWRLRDRYYNRKKKIQSSVWQVRDRYYDRKKKFQSSVWRVRDHYYDRKIKKFQSSVWRVGDRYYDRKKKSSSPLSGGCAWAGSSSPREASVFVPLSVSPSVSKG